MKKKIIAIMIIFSIFIISVIVTGCVVLAKNGSNKLYNLIDENKTDEAIELIEKTDDVNAYSTPLFFRRIFNAVETDIKLPLVHACEKDNYEIVEALLKKGANPNKYLDGNWSPIEATFINKRDNRLEIAKLLIEYGADVNLHGSDTSALFQEARHFIDGVEDENLSNQIVTLLINKGAKTTDEKGNSILHYVVAGNSILLTKNLINEYHLSIDTISERGKTPLIWGVEKNALDTVTFLIELGANKTIKDKDGKTALDYAKENGNNEIIKLLYRETGDGSVS